MNSQETRKSIQEETNVESAEYIRTPDGKNVTRKVIDSTRSTEERQ